MTSAPVTRRSARVDALKFAAIALVVLGHVIALPAYDGSTSRLFYVIGTFNMPLFMFLSGFVLFGREGDDPLRFVGSKFLALMVPYFAWLALGIVWYQPRSQWVPQLLSGLVNPHAPGRLWFLYVLFILLVLFTLVRLASTRDVWLVVAAGAVACLHFAPVGDYFGKENVQWLFGFLVAGYLTAKHRERMPHVTPQLLGAFVLAFAALLYVGRLPADGSGWPPWFVAKLVGALPDAPLLATLAFALWRYATAFAGIAVTVGAFMPIDPARLRAPAWAGRHTLGIYATHGWLLFLAPAGGGLAAAAGWVMILYVALAVAVLLDKTALTRVVLLGRWPRT